jgi:hypothetical protein
LASTSVVLSVFRHLLSYLQTPCRKGPVDQGR